MLDPKKRYDLINMLNYFWKEKIAQTTTNTDWTNMIKVIDEETHE
jgi:hypothetical protein